MDWLIEVAHLSRSFGNTDAIQDVSFHVAAGEIYGLVGPDGAGKTTTLRLLCGAYQPNRQNGQTTTVRIAGYDIFKELEQARTHIGYLSQRFSLYEDLTVLENIRFFAEMRGLASNQWLPRCMELLEFVSLAEFKDRLAGQLSGGMRQKLGLASALVTRPRILLLDEPTTGVDPVTRQDFWQLIIRLVSTPQDEQGVCVLISTPYMDEAARCHRIGFMRQGKIIAEGTANQLCSLLNERILELQGSPLPLLRSIAAQDPDVDDVHTFGNRLHIRLKEPQGKAVMQRLQVAITQAGGEYLAARSIPPALEDVFIALTNQEK
jgi:ABC-2 type transport system ATP-binding protein